VAFVGAFDALGIQTALGLSLPSPTIFAQYFVFAVLLGGIYGLIALGLTMIFGVMDVINFAHGALMVVAMYAVLVFSDATGLSPFSPSRSPSCCCSSSVSSSIGRRSHRSSTRHRRTS